jgi:hypothetical protein
LAELRGESAPLLADVRPRAAEASVRARGSVPIPVHALATSLAIQAGPVVLIAEGHGVKTVVTEARELVRAGRDVRILDGGLLAWCEAGGAVYGSCSEAGWMGASELRDACACPEQIAEGGADEMRRVAELHTAMLASRTITAQGTAQAKGLTRSVRAPEGCGCR